MARVVAVTGILLLALIQATMSITVQELFPDAKSNLTKITWSHATNSQDALKKALEGDIMMIEADVVLGWLNGVNTSSEQIPILGHPPANTSDLILDDLLVKVKANNKKGIKLDFKTIEALEKSIPVLQKYENLTVPLWINADILRGPVNAGNDPLPVDPKRFFAAAAKIPQALLSIGWTTRLDDAAAQNVTTGAYTSAQITEIVQALQSNKVNQSITYPVRACFAANNATVLETLLTNSKANNPTLTIWSSEGDKVDVDKLTKLIKAIGLDKVFVDVPQSLWEKLNLANSAFTVKSSISVMLMSLVVLFGVKLL